VGVTVSGSQDGPTVRKPRLPRRQDLVNVLEYEDVAKQVLDAGAYAAIAGGNRAAFDRMTFRPRYLVPTVDLDMTADLLGVPHFSPILVGPVAEQRRYHPDGELATVRGAAAAQASVVLSSRSSVPLADLAVQAKTPLWFSVYADGDARAQVDRAIGAGCTVVCIARPATPAAAAIPWKTIASIAKGLDVPVVIKGVMSAEDARTALNEGARGVIVSDHGAATGRPAPIETVAAVADAVSGKGAVLVDGAIRRGSDIAKALALGAQAVLIARPVMWGLAAYGADGVQAVVEMLQSDLGRNMGALGAPNVKAITRGMVRIDRR
jgi:4-hydroxymandelate oxidase